jgi:hypothetical protein
MIAFLSRFIDKRGALPYNKGKDEKEHW